MIVAIGIFSMVATLTMGSLLILTAAERHVSSVQINQDNVRFSLEAMAREIRTGDTYKTCSGLGSDNCFQFRNALQETIQYCLGTLDNVTYYAECSDSVNSTHLLRKVDDEDAHPITSTDITIDRLEFYLYGVVEDDVFQPRVTIVMKAIALEGQKNETQMNVQTSISQLDLDF